MAQWLPEKEKQRPLAYMLLGIILIMVYWLGFHWFFQRHAALDEQIDNQRQREARYQGMIEQRSLLATALQQVREFEANNDFFLAPDSASLASAELTTRLKELISLHANSAQECQVISNQNVKIREQERFQKVTNNVRLRCELEDFSKVLYYLESETPYIFIDNLSIYRQVTRRRRGRESVQRRILDVRFHLSGYIRNSSGALS